MKNNPSPTTMKECKHQFYIELGWIRCRKCDYISQPSEEKECKFCGEKHIDWEKECKYWGKPPVKITGDLESIPNSTALEDWEIRFDKQFRYKSINGEEWWVWHKVSDTLQFELKQFIKKELASQREDILAEILKAMPVKFPINGPTKYGNGYNYALKNVEKALSEIFEKLG